MGKTLILTGFMGAGKSAVAKLLGVRLGLPAFDLDARIEAETGVTIPEIFEKEGEEGFRRRESELLARLVSGGGRIVATGGGILTVPKNRELIEGAMVVNLSAPFEALYERIRGSEGRRPLLRGGPEKARELFELRRPLYEAVRLQVFTAGKSAAEVAEEVARLYEAEEGGAS